MFEPGDDAMDDVPICPEWWPKLIWDLHFHKVPWPGPGPINIPPVLDEIFKQLAMHTMTYSLQDQKAAQVTRTQIEESLSATVKNLSRMHDEMVKGR
jgi:hypothetical protein